MQSSTSPLPFLDDVLKALEHAFLHHTQPHVRRDGLVLQLPELDVSVRPMPGQDGALLEVLPQKLAEVAAFGLVTAITAPSPAGTRLRMDFISALARIEASIGQGDRRPHSPDDDVLLTTAEVASQLGMSRPHVSMLCDQGRLGEVIRSAGGHRRIRQSAVTAYVKALGTEQA